MRALLWRGGHCIEKYEPLFIGLIPCPLRVNGPFLFSFDIHWARCECWAPHKLHGSEIYSVPVLVFVKGRNDLRQHQTLSVFHHSLCLISLKVGVYFLTLGAELIFSLSKGQTWDAGLASQGIEGPNPGMQRAVYTGLLEEWI